MRLGGKSLLVFGPVKGTFIKYIRSFEWQLATLKKEGLDFKRDRPDLKGINSTAKEKTEETVCRLKTP